jgi:SAM-dependent methyltransferase
MGATNARKRFVREYIEDKQITTVLDIGCGPADILEYIGDVEYYGFDISEKYIVAAKQRFGDKGKFVTKNITMEDIDKLPKFDLVIMHGLLHHIDDETAIKILEVAKEALSPGGRLVTVDGCLEEGQNPIARFLIRNDRGRNVKSKDGYYQLASKVFSDINIYIHHQAWIPYTLCYMECRKEK